MLRKLSYVIVVGRVKGGKYLVKLSEYGKAKLERMDCYKGTWVYGAWRKRYEEEAKGEGEGKKRIEDVRYEEFKKWERKVSRILQKFSREEMDAESNRISRKGYEVALGIFLTFECLLGKQEWQEIVECEGYDCLKCCLAYRDALLILKKMQEGEIKAEE